MAWSLFEESKREGEKPRELKPKIFSNGKTQEDIVNETVKEIKNGRKIVFIHGVCGSGKSAIALNIAKELGRASIVVPIKNLQRQYESDYMEKKFVLKENDRNGKIEKLQIAMITGRNNHKCLYLQENKEIEKKQEKNSSIYNIFQQTEERPREDSCDNPIIPCKIEIKEKNLQYLRKYYKENPEAKENSDLNIKLLKRFAVAPSCPYWCPIVNSENQIKIKAEKKEYNSLAGKHSIYLRKGGCEYYRQFLAYTDADVIIFNSEQYMLESAIGRKPLTDVEIIDECDEFLDSFALEETINLSRLKNELNSLYTSEESERKLINALQNLTEETSRDALAYLAEKDNITKLDKTQALELIKSLTKSDVFDLIGDDSYLEHCYDVARKFYEITSEAYINFFRDKKNDLYIKMITINLDKLLSALIDKNKAFVFMSGTLHTEKVLREIFGLKDFKIIEAETFNQGTITKLKSGLERDFKYENFNNGKVTRKDFLLALDKCVQIAKIPIVVQVSAFQDIPTKQEIQDYDLRNLISSEELIEQQKQDKEGKIVKDFKEGKTKILFTTRCSRGIDFPFDTCNSVVITKFPYPNAQSLFWRILKKNKPIFYWDFYKDKAHRELLQRVYRSVRAADDHVFLLSPDIRVLDTKVL